MIEQKVCASIIAMPSLRLYEIDPAIRMLEDRGYLVDEETGELLIDPDGDAELFRTIDALEMIREEKLLHLARLIKERETLAEAAKKRREKTIARMRAAENALLADTERMRDYILRNLREGEKLRDEISTISARPSTRTVIDDVDALPDGLYSLVRKPAPAAQIASAIKAEGSIPGAHLETRNTLTIR